MGDVILLVIQVDNFIVTSGNIGEIQKIKIRSSNTGLGSAWHLNKVYGMPLHL